MGISDMKRTIRERGTLSIIQALRIRVECSKRNQVRVYFSLTGPTGTSKIKITIRMGFTLNRMDLLERGKTHLITCKDLGRENTPQ